MNLRPLPYFELKDGEDRIYGPFSPGWTTALLNLGGTEPPMMARAVGTANWVPYAKVKNKPAPVYFQNPDDGTMRREGYRLLHQLAVDRVRRERGELPAVPVPWDTEFASAVGFARQSCEIYSDAGMGIRIGYGTATATHASVYEYPIALPAWTDDELQEELIRQIELVRGTIKDLRAHGHYRTLRWVHPALEAGEFEESVRAFACFGFAHLEKRTINAYTGDFEFTEWIAIAPVGQKWLKIRYTHEACHAVFEWPRVTRFLHLARQTISAANSNL